MTLPVVIRLDTGLVKRLKQLAKITRKTKSFFINEAIEENLVDMELLHIAKTRSEDLKNGKSSTMSWEEVKKLNGLQD